MSAKRVVVIGAGIGGLSAAIELAAKGQAVTVLERQPATGGKMREVIAGGQAIDAGPTVFTMRWVFDEIFERAGASFADRVNLQPLDILARHAWSKGPRLDLLPDIKQSEDAIAAFAGPAEGRRYREFCTRAAGIYDTLEGPFMRSEQPTPASLALGGGLKGLTGMMRISPFTTLWQALGQHFHDPRLRQLFGRYATYCGSSPFEAPATLMLVAHVEQQGVWSVVGGMQRLAEAMTKLAEEQGVIVRTGTGAAQVIAGPQGVTAVELTNGERIETGAVIINADAAAIAAGLFGPDISATVPRQNPSHRSLSAVTFALNAKTSGFPLTRHNVFFSDNYQAEFDDIFKARRLPAEPTIYVCASDRDTGGPAPADRERLLVLINAPADGDIRPLDQADITAAAALVFARLSHLGLDVERDAETEITTTPAGFGRLFPATGGALYGLASHGWAASFSRPAARTRIPGLYLAGGSVHPGPGVPMAALSGRIAAQCLLKDQTSR